MRIAAQMPSTASKLRFWSTPTLRVTNFVSHARTIKTKIVQMSENLPKISHCLERIQMFGVCFDTSALYSQNNVFYFADFASNEFLKPSAP